MRVLVTGATGFLGANLVRRLLSDGGAVRVLVRSREKARSLQDAGAEAVEGGINDARALHAALDEVAVVYHLAGRLLEPGVAPSEYRTTHVEGTRTLLAAVHEARDLQRFVHVSTTGVLGVTGDGPVDETAPMRPTNVYESTKADAERAVADAIHTGLPAVIVRPGLVYGPGDLHLLGFFRSILHHQFRPIGRRPVWLHPIYVDDLIEAMIECGRSPAAVGECFNIAGPERVTLAGLAAAIAHAQGTVLPRGVIPLAAARTVATVGDLLPPRIRSAAPLTTSRLDFLTHSRVYNIEKAERLLGFRPATTLATGLERSVAWYRAQGYLPAVAAA